MGFVQNEHRLVEQFQQIENALTSYAVRGGAASHRPVGQKLVLVLDVLLQFTHLVFGQLVHAQSSAKHLLELFCKDNSDILGMPRIVDELRLGRGTPPNNVGVALTIDSASMEDLHALEDYLDGAETGGKVGKIILTGYITLLNKLNFRLQNIHLWLAIKYILHSLEIVAFEN